MSGPMNTFLKKLKKDKTGAALTIEFMIIFPALVLLIFITVEISMMYSASRRVSNAMGALANIVSARTELGKESFDLLAKGANLIIGANPKNVDLRVTSLSLDKNAVAKVVGSYAKGRFQKFSKGQMPQNIKIPESLSNPETSLIFVEIKYRYGLSTKAVFVGDVLKLNRSTFYRSRYDVPVEFEG